MDRYHDSIMLGLLGIATDCVSLNCLYNGGLAGR